MLTILQGDWIERLRELPSNHFHLCVTSPPYWGLRNYQVEGQLGLEKTPDEYVQKLVAGFREVRRTLRDDATLWLNLGDSYSGSGKGGNPDEGKQSTNKDSQSVGVLYEKIGETAREAALTNVSRRWTNELGIPPKNLIGIPWRVAFALQSDGWYLRQWMPWVKRNPMPESVTDRPGSACEVIFLLSKSDRYYYDAEAVKMPGKIPAGTLGAFRNQRNSDFFWDSWQGMLTYDDGSPLAMIVNTYPYRKAHFATFPPKLIEPIIRCGTSEMGCCPECGAGYIRAVERKSMVIKKSKRASEIFENHSTICSGKMVSPAESKTVGWIRKCDHYEFSPDPCRVLDPFGGSGTVAQVCNSLNRDATLIELNPEYIHLINERCNQPNLI